jgi:hypothetical protein
MQHNIILNSKLYGHSKEYHAQMAAPVKARVLFRSQYMFTKKVNSVAQQAITTKRPALVGEVSAMWSA